MRTIHTTCSSILLLSFITACSSGPLDDDTTGNTSESLSSSSGVPHVMPVHGRADVVVGGSCTSGSTLSNPNNKPVMHGTVNVYVIWYGSVNSSVISVLTNYIPTLSESSYLAMNSIYTDSNGPTTSTLVLAGTTTDAVIANASGLTGAPYSQGKALTDAKIKTEIDRAIAHNVFPRDSNGIYFVVTDSQVSETSSGGSKFCGTGANDFCAWHTHGANSTTDIKYAFIGDQAVCGGCQWPGDTPHGTQSDSAVTAFTHELIETLTDPGLNAWRVAGTATENGDLCNRIAGPTYHGGHPDFFGNLIGGSADLHLGSEDYLVQMDWVNPDSSGAMAYGLPFWGQNFGYTGSPSGDWAVGSYKAQCSSGQPVTGVAEDLSETHVNSVLCGSSPNWPRFPQSSSCYGLSFDPGNNMVANPEGDWDRGFYKAECNTNEFVAGVSQSVSGRVNGIMCCPGNLAHSSCKTEVFYGTNSSHYAGPDWDVGFYKGQCAAGKYVAGVSATVDGLGSAHALLCCSP